jgi:hypothetical protein
MNMRHAGGIGLAVLAVVTVACGFHRSGGGSSGSGSRPPAPIEATTPAQPAPPAESSPAAVSTGTVQVTFRGTNGHDLAREARRAPRMQCSVRVFSRSANRAAIRKNTAPGR